MANDFAEQFAKKKITIMGLGLLGKGIGDAEFLAEAGAELIVTDLKNETELRPSLERLAKFRNITYHLGGHRMEDFEDRDLIVRANNAPLDSPYLARARERGIPTEMDSSLFAKLSKAAIVGITGTRGKSTITHLIYRIVKAAGKDPLLGGNERGMATLPLLNESRPGRLAILELDSWQLQGFAGDKISPHVAVWNNFLRDHMNYYHGDMDRYFEDKSAIARFQKQGDYFVTSQEIKEKVEERFGPLSSTCVTVGGAENDLPGNWKIALPGEHNRANAAFALAAARTIGIADDVSQSVIENFKGLPGRLEFLGEKSGVAFYNDSNATTPEAAIAALRTLLPEARRRGGNIVLIAGGSDKELVFTDLAPVIAKMASRAVLFTGNATEKLRALLPKAYPVALATNMAEAVAQAARGAERGDIVLLSPGATSFGIFKNEYDRGDQFRELVEKLK